MRVVDFEIRMDRHCVLELGDLQRLVEAQRGNGNFHAEGHLRDLVSRHGDLVQ